MINHEEIKFNILAKKFRKIEKKELYTIFLIWKDTYYRGRSLPGNNIYSKKIYIIYVLF